MTTPHQDKIIKTPQIVRYKPKFGLHWHFVNFLTALIPAVVFKIWIGYVKQDYVDTEFQKFRQRIISSVGYEGEIYLTLPDEVSTSETAPTFSELLNKSKESTTVEMNNLVKDEMRFQKLLEHSPQMRGVTERLSTLELSIKRSERERLLKRVFNTVLDVVSKASDIQPVHEVDVSVAKEGAAASGYFSSVASSLSVSLLTLLPTVKGWPTTDILVDGKDCSQNSKEEPMKDQ